MTVPLKACPFCTEPPEVDTQRGFIGYDRKHRNAVAIYCTKCSAEMSLCNDDFPHLDADALLSILADQWNTRHGKLSSSVEAAQSPESLSGNNKVRCDTGGENQ